MYESVNIVIIKVDCKRISYGIRPKKKKVKWRVEETIRVEEED